MDQATPPQNSEPTMQPKKSSVFIDLDSSFLDKNKELFCEKLSDSAFLTSIMFFLFFPSPNAMSFWFQLSLMAFSVATWSFVSAFFKHDLYSKYIHQPCTYTQLDESKSTLKYPKRFLNEDPTLFAFTASMGHLIGCVLVAAGAIAANSLLGNYFNNTTMYGALSTTCGLITAAKFHQYSLEWQVAFQYTSAYFVTLLSIWLAVFYLT